MSSLDIFANEKSTLNWSKNLSLENNAWKMGPVLYITYIIYIITISDCLIVKLLFD